MKSSILLLTFLLLINNLVFAQAPIQAAEKSELETLLEEANGYFREAMETAAKDEWKAKKLYEKAAVYYEKIVTDSNIKNGRLFYNIGNSYFKMGDIGRAILNYLKAQQYLPDDKNIIQNLEFARSKRVDKVEEKQEAMWLKILFFFHFYTTPLVRLILFTSFFFLVWIFAILLLFFRQGLLKFFLVISLCIMLLFMSSLLSDVFVNTGEKPGVILGSEIVARKGDSETYEKSFQDPLHAGTEFLLQEERRSWYNIELKDGRTCWIPAKEAGLVK